VRPLVTVSTTVEPLECSSPGLPPNVTLLLLLFNFISGKCRVIQLFRAHLFRSSTRLSGTLSHLYTMPARGIGTQQGGLQTAKGTTDGESLFFN
jgi:hypothetical protein